MPSEMDPMHSAESVQKNYDKLIADNTKDIVPLKPEDTKTHNVERQTLGGKDGIKTKAQFVSREAISAYSRTAQTNQPKSSLFAELVSKTYRYIKQKLSRPSSRPSTNMEISRPFNVKALNAEAHLGLAKIQLASLEHNLKNPGEKQLELDSNYPQALIPLKNLISQLETKIKEIKENKIQALADFGEEEVYEYDQANKKEGSSYEQLYKEFDDKPLPMPKDKDTRSPLTTGMLKRAEGKLKFHEGLERIKGSHPKEKNSLTEFRAEVKTLQDAIKNDQVASFAAESKINNLNSQIANLEAKLDSLYSTEDSTPESILQLHKAIDQLQERKNAISPEVRIKVNSQQLIELKKRRETEIEQFKETIGWQEKELSETMEALKNLPKVNPDDYSDHQAYLDDRTDRIIQEDDLIIKKEELEGHIDQNYAVLNDIVDELEVLNPPAPSATKAPNIGALKDLDIGPMEVTKDDWAYPAAFTSEESAQHSKYILTLQQDLGEIHNQIKENLLLMPEGETRQKALNKLQKIIQNDHEILALSSIPFVPPLPYNRLDFGPLEKLGQKKEYLLEYRTTINLESSDLMRERLSALESSLRKNVSENQNAPNLQRELVIANQILMINKAKLMLELNEVERKRAEALDAAIQELDREIQDQLET